MSKLEQVIDYFNQNKIKFLDKWLYLLDDVHDLFINTIIPTTNDNNMLTLIGKYYHVNKNYMKMEQYYKMAIKLNDTNAMHNLGC